MLVIVAIIGPILCPFDFNDDPEAGPVNRRSRPAAVAGRTRSGETGGLQRDVLLLVVERRADVAPSSASSSMIIGVIIGHDRRRRRGLSSAASSTTS